MKNKIIIIAIIGLILGGLSYQSYVIYKVKNQAELAFQQANIATQVLNMMGTADKDGITGFDRLVAVTLNKLNKK